MILKLLSLVSFGTDLDVGSALPFSLILMCLWIQHATISLLSNKESSLHSNFTKGWLSDFFCFYIAVLTDKQSENSAYFLFLFLEMKSTARFIAQFSALKIKVSFG